MGEKGRAPGREEGNDCGSAEQTATGRSLSLGDAPEAGQRCTWSKEVEPREIYTQNLNRSRGSGPDLWKEKLLSTCVVREWML